MFTLPAQSREDYHEMVRQARIAHRARGLLIERRAQHRADRQRRSRPSLTGFRWLRPYRA